MQVSICSALQVPCQSKALVSPSNLLHVAQNVMHHHALILPAAGGNVTLGIQLHVSIQLCLSCSERSEALHAGSSMLMSHLLLEVS